MLGHCQQQGAYVPVTGVMASESIQKLVSKIGNIKDVVRFPYFVPCRIVSEDSYAGVLQSVDLWKPEWPKGLGVWMRPRPFCRSSQAMDKYDVNRRSPQIRGRRWFEQNL